MSSVVISGDTSGSITLQAPAVAGTTTLTLPSTSGTVLTSATQLIGNGTTTNDNASTGQVGEYVSSTVSTGAPVSLPSASTATNITSISLTAGDWDISGYGGFAAISGTSTVTFIMSGFSSSSGSVSFPPAFTQYLNNTSPSTVLDAVVAIPTQRYSLSATTTIYLVSRCSYIGGSMGGYGQIRARRMR